MSVIAPEKQLTKQGQVLERAARIIEEYGWTQWCFARDDEGRELSWDDERATSFCALGALNKAISDGPEFEFTDVGSGRGLWERLAAAAGTYPELISVWNDQPGRRKEQVVAALREAAGYA